MGGRGDYTYGSLMGASVLSSLPDQRSYGEFTASEHLHEHSYTDSTKQTYRIKPKPAKGSGKQYARMSFQEAYVQTKDSVGPGSYYQEQNRYQGGIAVNRSSNLLTKADP